MILTKKTKIYTKIILLFLLTILLIFISVKGFTYAKYAYNKVWNYYLNSKGFYFSSDYLDTTTVNNNNKLWDGNSVHFNIKNNLNKSVITEYDIDYQATCEIVGDAAEKVKCNMNGSNTNTYTGVLSSYKTCINNTSDGVDTSSYSKSDCEINGYSYELVVAEKDLYFDIELTDENYTINDLVVNIEVQSLSPYSVTLLGSFDLHKVNTVNDLINIQYSDFSNYGELIISNLDTKNKCISVKFDSGELRVDTTESDIIKYNNDDNDYINEFVVNINSMESLKYNFYKTDFDKSYDLTKFIVEESNLCN